jgi:alpha-L-fucosidase 2
LRDLLHLTGEEGTKYANGGGTYANLFDAHPPFQIDGNFGATAGIAEMLLQSQYDDIYLLPALPDVWKNGEVRGLKARGNYVVDIIWKDNKLSKSTITAVVGGLCKIRSNTPLKVTGSKARAKNDGNTYVIAFQAQKGKTYEVLAAN